MESFTCKDYRCMSSSGSISMLSGGTSDFNSLMNLVESTLLLAFCVDEKSWHSLSDSAE